MATVLVLEDVAPLMILTESILQEAGHQTLTAANAVQAQAILDNDTHVDVLLADINLGDDAEGGLRVASEAVATHPNLKVVYATGQTITDGIRALMADGSTLLPKPYTAPQLTEAVEMAIGGNNKP